MKTDRPSSCHRLDHTLWCFWLVRPLPKNPWLLRRLSSPPLILHFYIVLNEYGKDGADAEIVLLKRKGKIDVRSISVADFIRENILKQKSYKQLVFFSISDNKQGLTLRARYQPLFYWFVVFLFGEEVYALQPRFCQPV